MKVAKRLIGAIILVTFTMLLMVACSDEPELTISVDDTAIEMSTNNFSGMETHSVALEEGTAVLVSAVTNAGVISFSVTDETGNVVASGNGVTGNNMSFGITVSGNYTIEIISDSHSGRFSISWQ